MQDIQVGETTASRRRVFLALTQTDGLTPVTGESGTPEISYRGANFISTTNALVEVSNGYYYVELTTAEIQSSSIGIFCVRYKTGATAEAKVLGRIVPWNPYDANLGFTNLDAAVSSRSSLVAADILAQVTAALTAAISEPSAGAPPATPSIVQALIYLYEAAFDKEIGSSTYLALHNSSGVELCRATLSQASGVLTRSRFSSPP